jgi:hypothetical protein
VLLWRRKDQGRRYEFKAYRGATGYNAACGKKPMTWTQENAGKLGSGGLLYRYRRYNKARFKYPKRGFATTFY